MTPLKRRKLIQRIFIIVIVMISGVIGRFLFLDQSIPSLLLGRRSDSLPAGTQLIQNDPDMYIETNRVKDVAGPQSPIDLSYDVLGGWKYIDGKTPLPPQVTALNGKWVRISGFMFSGNSVNAAKRFILVQSLWSCCFGKAPDMNHFIDVSVEPGRISKLYNDPVTITGKLSVGEEREKGHLMSLYRLEAHEIVVR